MKKLIALCCAIILLAGCKSKNQDKELNMKKTNREKAVELLKSLETGDSTPVSYINPEKYIQHNLNAGDGLAGFGELLKQLPEGSVKVNVIRAFEDGDYVFTHTDYNFFGPKAGFDIFRFENGKMVEHWDNLAEKAVKVNPSNHTQFDGTTEISDLEKTEDNKKLVNGFVQDILIDGKMEKMNNYIDGENYIQHNTMIADGLSGLGKAFEEMARQGIKMIYSKNHMILGEGNFVLAVSEGEFAGKHVSFYDLFRVENNRIAEHWDTIEEIPAREKWANDNGKF